MQASSTASAQATSFRRLLWSGSVPLQIKIFPGDIPAAGSASSIDSYYIQALRQTYLPLLLGEIRENLVELVLDDQALASIREADWWFEDEGGGGVMKWHWPVGLLYDHSLINNGSVSLNTFPPASSPALTLILHLSTPPSDKLLLSNSLEACKTAFMGAVKEADFVRWGSVKRVTGLRRGEQDALWDGIRQNDFDLHSRIAARLFPLPLLSSSSAPSSTLDPPSTPSPYNVHPPSSPNPNQPPSRPGSTEPGSQGSLAGGKPDSSWAVRSVPMKVYLPEGAMVLQEVAGPFISSNPPSSSQPHPSQTPSTLISYLQLHLPLLFPLNPPPLPPPPPFQSSSLSSAPSPYYALAFPIVQGIVPPPESELAWLGACMVGADGWVNVCVALS